MNFNQTRIRLNTINTHRRIVQLLERFQVIDMLEEGIAIFHAPSDPEEHPRDQWMKDVDQSIIGKYFFEILIAEFLLSSGNLVACKSFLEESGFANDQNVVPLQLKDMEIVLDCFERKNIEDCFSAVEHLKQKSKNTSMISDLYILKMKWIGLEQMNPEKNYEVIYEYFNKAQESIEQIENLVLKESQLEKLEMTLSDLLISQTSNNSVEELKEKILKQIFYLENSNSQELKLLGLARVARNSQLLSFQGVPIKLKEDLADHDIFQFNF